MLYEGDQALVPLSKELKLMIAEYVSIEKDPVWQQAELQIDLPEECNDQPVYRSPAVCCPFVENFFKHGTSTFLENPWLSLADRAWKTRSLRP